MARNIFLVLLAACATSTAQKPAASVAAPNMCNPCNQPCTAYPGCAQKPATVAAVTPAPAPAPAPVPAPVVAPPPPAAAIAEFSPAPGTYAVSESVRITSATPGAVVHCTTDGTEPTAASPVCMDPVPVASNTTLKAIVIAPGFADSAVVSGEYAITPPPPPVEAAAPPIELREMVFFDLGAAQVRPESFTLLDDIAEVLKAHPEIAHIKVTGHADSLGSEEYNLALSKARAEAVRSSLIERGIDPNRIVFGAVGEAQPIGDNETETGRSVNRRVELSTGE